jgi:hypothetical protein
MGETNMALLTTSCRSPHARRTVPIARLAGLFLYAGAGDGERFADAFHRTLFQRLPRSAANALLAYWEEGPPEQVTKPTVELLPQLRPGVELSADAPDRVWAATLRRGHVFRFLAGVCDLMPSFSQRMVTNISRSHSSSPGMPMTSTSSLTCKGEMARLAMQVAVFGATIYNVPFSDPMVLVSDVNDGRKPPPLRVIFLSSAFATSAFGGQVPA